MNTTTLRIEYCALDEVCFPQEMVNVWRGLIGKYVHRISSQLTEFFFETPQSILRALDGLDSKVKGKLGLQGSHVPHPFILRSPHFRPGRARCKLNPGDLYVLELILIEDAVKYLPLLCALFEDLGLSGVGTKLRQKSGRIMRGRMRLQRMQIEGYRMRYDVFDGASWSMPESVVIREYLSIKHIPFDQATNSGDRASSAGAVLKVSFKTPVRLLNFGKVVNKTSLTPAVLSKAIFRRFYALVCCYADDPPSAETLASTRQQLEKLSASSRIKNKSLHWSTRARYSGRQRKTVSTSGLLGSFELHAQENEIINWQRHLSCIGFLHMGKGTSYGHGWVTHERVAKENITQPKVLTHA